MLMRLAWLFVAVVLLAQDKPTPVPVPVVEVAKDNPDKGPPALPIPLLELVHTDFGLMTELQRATYELLLREDARLRRTLALLGIEVCNVAKLDPASCVPDWGRGVIVKQEKKAPAKEPAKK